jgi:radical SAM superfamily enzyme YgiQ (UPF0313 family)
MCIYTQLRFINSSKAEKNMRIALISLLSSEQLRAKQTGWHTFNDLEPYGLECIAAVAKENGHETRLFHPYQSKNPSEEAIAKEATEYKPNVLAISAYTNSFPRSVAIAQTVKSRIPSVKIVVGGDHITSFPENLLGNRIIDLAVIGEGETTFGQLLDSNFENLDIPGLAYLKDGALKLTPWRNRVRDRGIFPRALRDGEIMAKSRVGSLMYPAPSKQTGTASVMLNFGCPLGCTYCTETTVGKGKVGKRNADDVVRELGELKQNFGTNTAMFLDLTFNLYSNQAEELCKRLAKANLGVNWYGMIRVTSPNGTQRVKPSLLEAMASAGASKIAFGIESTEPEAIKDYHRSVSIQQDECALREIDRIGVLSKVLLIIGHPEEKRDYYDSLINHLKILTPDEVRISFITPFPGTELWKNKVKTGEWSLTSRDWSEYTTFNQVVEMNYIGQRELDTQRRRILRAYYSSPEFERHLRNKVSANPHLEQSYKEFLEVLKVQKVI